MIGEPRPHSVTDQELDEVQAGSDRDNAYRNNLSIDPPAEVDSTEAVKPITTKKVKVTLEWE